MIALFDRSGNRTIYAVVAVLSALVFGWVVPGEFISDDLLWAMPSSAADQRAALETIGHWTFRPLGHLLFRGVLSILGSNASAWHVFSILLHIFNGILVFHFAIRVIPEIRRTEAVAASLLFVLHPAGSEAVLWISALSELTVSAAVLSFLLLYLSWRENWTVARIGVVCILFFGACLVKETAIVFPAVVFLYEAARGRAACSSAWRPLAALAIAATCFLVLRTMNLGSIGGGLRLSVDFGRVVEFALAHATFLWLPHAPPFAIRSPEVALAAGLEIAAAVAVLAAFSFAGWRARDTRATVILAWAWGVLFLWPAYAVAIVEPGFFNGRQAYLPSVGVVTLVVLAWSRVPDPARNWIRIPAAALLMWMAFSSASQALLWRTNDAVISQSLAVSPNNPDLRSVDAARHAERTNGDAALRFYAEAATHAKDPGSKASYLYQMARIHGEAGRFEESNRLLHEVIALQPDNANALTGLGNNAWAAGNVTEAERHYRRALAVNPGNFEAKMNLTQMLKHR